MTPSDSSPKNPQAGTDHQRWAAVGLLAAQAVLIGYVSETIIFPVVVVLLALGALAIRPIDASVRMRFWLIASVFILFVVKFNVVPLTFPVGRDFVASSLAHAIAQLLVGLQLVLLFLKPTTRKFPMTISRLALVAVVFACDVQLTSQERDRTVWLMVLFAGAAGAYFSASRRVIGNPQRLISGSRSVLLAVAVLLIGILTATSSAALLRYERRLEGLIITLLESSGETSRAGFSGQAHLSSVQNLRGTQSNAIALRVVSPREPGYLRGKVFDVYQTPSWGDTAVHLTLPESSPPRTLPEPEVSVGEHFFSLGSPLETASQTLTVWREIDAQGELFTPLETNWLQLSIDDVLMDDYRHCISPKFPSDLPYTCYLPETTARQELTPYLRRRLLQLPPGLDPRVKGLADFLFRDCRNDAEKIAAVTLYFHENYAYKIGIQVPENRDPLTFFLLEQVPAHCEYFASGAAILLRLGGVPCRYVTGFMVLEQNSLTGEWIARNQHAHAWVEAYDSEQGWQIVEATPAEGQPQVSEQSALQKVRESFSTWLKRMRSRWQLGGAFRIFKDVLWFTLLVLLPWIAWKWRAVWLRRWRAEHRKPSITPDPARQEMRTLLKSVMANLKALDYHREPSETIHQFARRLRAADNSHPELHNAADWLLQYAALRYQPRLTLEDVKPLRDRISAKESGAQN